MLGRDFELARIDDLLAQAAGGNAEVCLIVGDAGVGKTALCRHTMQKAREDGDAVWTLSAQGVEDEARFTYSVLADLLRPLGDLIDHLPDRWRLILEGIVGRSLAPTTDVSGVGVAMLAALGAAAEFKPVLVVVDDAHWCDPLSLEALAFALRRLIADPVATLLTSRPPVPRQLTGFPTSIELRGLELQDGAELVRSAVPNVDPAVAFRLAKEVAGNPLALREISALLTPDQLVGRDPLPDPLPTGPQIALSFVRPMQALPARTRQALATCALAGSAADRLLAPALATLGLELSDLLPAEEARLVEVQGGTFEFRHPVIRTAASELVGPSQRRKIHAALAVAAEDVDPERYAWELDGATVGASEQVAEAFEIAAASVSAQRGLAAAAELLHRAAEVGASPDRRPDRLLVAARAAFLAGEPHTCLARLSELDAVCGSSPPPEAAVLRAQVSFWADVPDARTSHLFQDADRVAADDPDAAARIFSLASLFAIRRGDLSEVARARAHLRLLEPRLSVSAAATVAGLGAFIGVLTDDWAPMLAEMDNEQLWQALRRDDPHSASVLCNGLTMADRPDLAVHRASDIIDDLRAAGAITGLPYILCVSGQASWLLGHWSQAEAAVHESGELADQTGQSVLVANALAFASIIAAARGDGQRCLALADEADRILQPLERVAAALPLYLLHARGLWSLGDGRIADACHHLTGAFAIQSSLPAEIPTFARFLGDLLEALSAAGRGGEAREVLAESETMKAARWSPWLNGVVLRGHGLVDSDDQAAKFDQSLETLAPWDRWESARTRLCYGRHLRRMKHRREASEHLRAALSTFERLGARGWAAQARQELRSSGIRADAESWRPTGLTAQELRVALAVAGGGTNREVAAALFMSPKTVEHHLGRAFVKLGVTSRTQLARMVEARELDDVSLPDGAPNRGQQPGSPIPANAPTMGSGIGGSPDSPGHVATHDVTETGTQCQPGGWWSA